MVRAVEDAEDDADAARRRLCELDLAAGDAVVAISASGSTPFALGGVEAARAVGARSIAITNDPNSALASAAEISIVPETGAEVIAGSTRMKAGLSQKMVLHLLSTTAMVRLGHVDGNLMTNLMPTSQKLRDRRLRIVMEMTGVDERSASNALDACGGIVSEAARLAKA